MMINLKTKVLIDMEDRGFSVKLAAQLQRMGIYAVESREENAGPERELLFEKYRIIISDDENKYSRSCAQVIVITDDNNIKDPMLFHKSILYVSKKLGVGSICSLVKFHTDCGGNKVKAERAASRFLRDVGVQVNLKGYKYLRAAIVYTTMQPEIAENAASEIYDIVAEIYGVQSCSVERAMRNSIELAYERSSEQMRKKFDYPVAKPSNTELIIYAADTIRTWVL